MSLQRLPSGNDANWDVPADDTHRVDPQNATLLRLSCYSWSGLLGSSRRIQSRADCAGAESRGAEYGGSKVSRYGVENVPGPGAIAKSLGMYFPLTTMAEYSVGRFILKTHIFAS